MPQPKRLIEVSLPLQAISKQSAREKSIRHGHISTLHIWWARRPLAAMRAAIFASLMPAPESDAERKRLENLIATIVDWDQVKAASAVGNSPAIEEAKRLIAEAFPDGPPTLLDPFMGGGSTGLEALRLGCETHAVELNPVAHLIELCTLVYPQKYGQPDATRRAEQPKQSRLPGQEEPEQMAMDLPAAEGSRNRLAEDVGHWGNWVLERAHEEIGHLYENPAGDETVVGYLWARTIPCQNPACNAESPLIKQFWLAKKKNKRIAYRPVPPSVPPTSGEGDTVRVDFELLEDAEAIEAAEFDPSEGTVSRANARCPVCGQVTKATDVRRLAREGQMGERMVAMIFHHPDQFGKRYRLATEEDERVFAEAEAYLEKKLANWPYLESPLPEELVDEHNHAVNRLPMYGMPAWKDMFNPRQQLALVTFLEKIKCSYERVRADCAEIGAWIGADESRWDTDVLAKAVVGYLAIILDRVAPHLTVVREATQL